MSTKMSPDFERLSAYIDNQLSPAEKATLEARLAKEADLQATLRDLRRTVLALRSLPAVKPPRNFTLTPQQVSVRAQRGPLFPVFRLAAALCSLLLALAVVRDYATSGVAVSAVADVTTQSGGATAFYAPNVAPLLTPTPEGSQDSFGASAPVPTGSASQDAAVTPLAHFAGIQPSATPSVTSRLAPDGATPDATSKNAAPTDTPQDMAISAAAAAPSATVAASPNASLAQTTNSPGPSVSWRVVEIVLAALALALAGAAWLTRRG